MKYQKFSFCLLSSLAILFSSTTAQSKPASAQVPDQKKGKAKMTSQTIPERSAISEQYKWKTEDLFPSDEAWDKERKSLIASFKAIAQCRGKLKEQKDIVRTCLERRFTARKRLARLSSYAYRKYDEDTRVSRYQGMKEVIDKVSAQFLSVTSFIEPELLAMPQAKLQGFIADKSFSDYEQYLKDILRLKAHILSSVEENILAETSLMRDSGYNTYSSFSGADLKFPTIRDEKGKPVQLSQAFFIRYRASANRNVRKAAFDTFFNTFGNYKNTLASLLSSQINANIVYAKARRYKSALEAALDQNNIPTSVYHSMIKAVNKHLPTLHRYLKLRQELLGLKDLQYYDMYPPIVKKVDLDYPYEKATQVIAEALAPMGKDYVDILSQGLKPGSGWVDIYPNQGKKSGAYMDGSGYGIHPYVLMNYLDKYESMSTLAHEMGHALHSYLSNKNQPFSKADYAIFVAEVASTLNESLLMKYMLNQVQDPKKRLFLLGEQMEGFRQTMFRQAMFAEFELALYEHAEKKEALTAEQITKIYLEIVRRYYGHDQGVVNVDNAYGMEWAYVQHFYYNFYVYQYATGITAATALAEMIVKNGAPARDKYIKYVLSAGCSDYPIAELKRAGVDLTTTKPYDIAMGAFERALTEAEGIVHSMKKKP